MIKYFVGVFMDITGLEFDEVREWINVEHDSNNASWDDLFIKPKNFSVEEFLEFQVNMNHWPKMSVEDWKNLVESDCPDLIYSFILEES